MNSTPQNSSARRTPSLRGILWEARTQILLWYAGLFLLLGSLAIPTFRWVLFRRIDTRVRADLIEQMAGFETALGETPQDVPAAIDRFVRTTRPEDENYYLFFLGDRFYISTPKALPAEIAPDTDLVRELAQKTKAFEGERDSDDPEIQALLYAARPIQTPGGEIAGTFIGVHAAAGERQEALVGTVVFAQTIAACIAVSFVLSWLISGRVLAPVRELTATARDIGEAGLEQRLEVRGYGEMAILAGTFNAMLDRLQEVIVSQRDFMSDAGHELRTPITIVRGHLELMGDDPEEQREALEIAIDELDRIERMVEEMSLLAKAERPDFVRPTLVGLSEFTTNLYNKAKTLGERDWQLASVAGESAWADPQRLTEAMMNLVQNAVEHTRPGDTITIGSLLEANRVKFWVRDTGSGIPPEYQQRIFERFVRLGKPTAHASGAGLGLSIVRAIIEAHGGRVDVSSQQGVGSTFVISLPQALDSLIRRAQS